MSQIPVKLLVNGRVYSPTHPEATAMAVRGDVVAWLGVDVAVHEPRRHESAVEILHVSVWEPQRAGLAARDLTRAVPTDGRRLCGRPSGSAAVGSRLG